MLPYQEKYTNQAILGCFMYFKWVKFNVCLPVYVTYS